MNNSRIRKLVILLGLIFIATLAYPLVANKSSSTLNIKLAPTSADISIDGESVKTGNNKVKNGKHKIEAQQEGFETFEKEVDISTDDEIVIILKPNSDVGKKFLADNIIYQQEIEGLNGLVFNENADKRAQRYPYLDILPISGSKFTVAQGLAFNTKKDPETAIALYVDAPDPLERKNALKNIIDTGIKPEEVEIVFENQLNLFVQEAGGDE